MRHNKFQECLTLVKAGIPVLLTGEKGSGKTTLAIQVAKELDLPFYSVSMTRQTTLSYLMGFMNVSGAYVPSLLRRAVEEGGMYLLDEMDAGDPNVLLSLNTIENGFVSFPDKIVELHPNFRLMGSSNPAHLHAHYTGRAKLDAATLDRFDEIVIPRDEELEKSLVDSDTYANMTALREALTETNSGIVLSMRDSLRFQKRKELGLLAGYLEKLTGHEDFILKKYKEKLKTMPRHTSQSDCETMADLLHLLNSENDTEWEEITISA